MKDNIVIDLEQMRAIMAINDLADRLLSAQEKQAQLLSELLQACDDFATECNKIAKKFE